MYIDIETRNEIHRPVGRYYAVDGSLRDETWLTKNRSPAIEFFMEESSRPVDTNESGARSLYVVTFNEGNERESDRVIGTFTVSPFVVIEG